MDASNVNPFSPPTSVSGLTCKLPVVLIFAVVSMFNWSTFSILAITFAPSYTKFIKSILFALGVNVLKSFINSHVDQLPA